MSRGLGEAALAADLPESVVAAAAVLTQLGSAWFAVLAVLALLAVAARRSLLEAPLSDALGLWGLVLVASATTTVLKALAGLPRPPGAATATLPSFLPGALAPLYGFAATGDGFGFPSGHATLAAAFYGGLAATLRVGGRTRRYALAGVVVAVVALTRVVLGVHYLVDVVAGVAVGLGVVVVLSRHLTDPTHRLEAALALALPAVALDPTVDSLLVLLGAVAGLLACSFAPTDRSPRPA